MDIFEKKAAATVVCLLAWVWLCAWITSLLPSFAGSWWALPLVLTFMCGGVLVAFIVFEKSFNGRE